MKGMFKLFVFALLVGGWALASSAVTLVRSQGPCPYVGRLTLMTKDHLTYKQTWIDTTKWSEADFAAHPDLAQRLNLKKTALTSGSCEACDMGASATASK